MRGRDLQLASAAGGRDGVKSSTLRFAAMLAPVGENVEGTRPPIRSHVSVRPVEPTGSEFFTDEASSVNPRRVFELHECT